MCVCVRTNSFEFVPGDSAQKTCMCEDVLMFPLHRQFLDNKIGFSYQRSLITEPHKVSMFNSSVKLAVMSIVVADVATDHKGPNCITCIDDRATFRRNVHNKNKSTLPTKTQGQNY